MTAEEILQDTMLAVWRSAAAFENIGRDRAISVVGALQDDMERYAVGSSSLYIKLRRTSDAHAYNQAPVIVARDSLYVSYVDNPSPFLPSVPGRASLSVEG